MSQQKFTEAGKWRNIVEMSNMINNDEKIFYTDSELKWKSVYRDGVVEVSRQVYVEENLEYIDSHMFEEKSSSLTGLLDAYFKLKSRFAAEAKIFGFSPQEMLARHVMYSYYDCMSGGMSYTEIYLVRLLIKQGAIDKTEPIDGGKLNLNSFLTDTQDVEVKFNRIMLPELPPLT